MSKEEFPDVSLDILGIKPVANAVEKVTDATVHGAMGFLRLICRPASEEFGLLLQDNVKAWRAVNAARLVKKAEIKFKAMGYPASFKASPRLVSKILEDGSWVEDDNLQEMWAGLLTSSCTENAKDDGNLIFSHILNQLTQMEAAILNYICEKGSKGVGQSDRMRVAFISLKEMEELVQTFDAVHQDRLGRELEHLESLGLLETRWVRDVRKVNFPSCLPSELCLHLFVRCQGSSASLFDYFKDHPSFDPERRWM